MIAGKPEVSPIPSGKSQGVSSNNTYRSNSAERIRKLEEENARLLMKLDPLRDKLAKITVELEEKKDKLQEKTIQLETRQKYSNLPDSIHLQTIDELAYDLLVKERQVKILKEKIVPHY